MEIEYLIIWHDSVYERKVWLTEKEIHKARDLYNSENYEELESLLMERVSDDPSTPHYINTAYGEREFDVKVEGV